MKKEAMEMIKHYLEAIYLPMVRSNRASSIEASNTFSGFQSVMIVCTMLTIGCLIPQILKDVYHEMLPLDSLAIATSIILAADFFTKLLFGKDKDNGLATYITLPVKRRGFLTFAFVKWFFSIETWGIIIIFIPSCLSLIAPVYGYSFAIGWLMIFTAWSMANTLFALEFKYVSSGLIIQTTTSIAYALWAVAANQYGVATLPIRWICSECNPLFILVFSIILFVIICELYIHIIGNNRYAILENTGNSTGGFKLTGLLGDSYILKLKLRMLGKKNLIPVFGMPFICLIIPNNVFLMAVICTLYIMTFGSHTFNMESDFFDRISTINVDFSAMIKADFLINSIFILLFTIITSIISPQLIPTIISIALLCAGPVSFVYFYSSVYLIQRVDWKKGNSIGGKANIIKKSLISIVSLAIVIPPAMLVPEDTLIIISSVIGVGFIITYPLWTKLIVKNFLKKKYRYLSIYREKF